MRKELLKKLSIKIEKDMEEIDTKLLALDKEQIISDSYRIATLQSFYDAFDYYIDDCISCDEECEDEYEFVLDENEINKLLNINSNVIEFLTDQWFGFSHPERYAFWYDYSSVIEVVQDILKYTEIKQTLKNAQKQPIQEDVFDEDIVLEDLFNKTGGNDGQD